MKLALRNKTAKKKKVLKWRFSSWLVLSYMHTTLYMFFFYSNNITKFYVGPYVLYFLTCFSLLLVYICVY